MSSLQLFLGGSFVSDTVAYLMGSSSHLVQNQLIKLRQKKY